MVASVITLVLLSCIVLWIFAWQRGSQLAVGMAIGATLVLIGGPLIRSVDFTGHLPVWVPALPFALVAVTLFGFGLLAWFWSED